MIAMSVPRQLECLAVQPHAVILADRQTRLSDRDRDKLIMDCIIGQAVIDTPVILH